MSGNTAFAIYALQYALLVRLVHDSGRTTGIIIQRFPRDGNNWAATPLIHRNTTRSTTYNKAATAPTISAKRNTRPM